MPPNVSLSTITTNTTSTTPRSSNVGVLHSGNKIHKPELVKKIGGSDVLKQAVNNFYDRLTVDPDISKFFHGADIQVLRWHQFNIMSIAFHDIPEGFDLRGLVLRRHERLFDEGLDAKTYDIVLEHFCQTLRDLKVSEETITEALAVVQPYRVVFEEGAQLAAARREKDLRDQRFWRLVLIGSISIYIGATILLRRRKK
jgi:hemoglobin